MSVASPERLSGSVLVGTSGFSYPDWKGPFYPEKIRAREMLAYYAGAFPGVELNSSFYAIPQPRNMQIMVEKTEGKLEFSVKAHRDMTHSREKSQEAVGPFLEALKPLQAHRVLGCVLLQFPYSFHHNQANRDYLIELKRRLEGIPVVAEFRNRWWFQERTMGLLRREGIGFCCVDEPQLPGLLPPAVMATSDLGYIRFHGRNREKWWRHESAHERYDYEYSDSELREWVVKIEFLRQMVKKLYIFFNNHPRGQAVRNARTLMSMLGLS